MRTAVVTGAASGMGSATADLLLAEGWSVLALDRTASEIGPAGGPTAKTVTVDITRRAEVHAAIADHLSGREVHLVANIAGVYPPTTLETADEETYRRIFDVNVLGVVNV